MTTQPPLDLDPARIGYVHTLADIPTDLIAALEQPPGAPTAAPTTRTEAVAPGLPTRSTRRLAYRPYRVEVPLPPGAPPEDGTTLLVLVRADPRHAPGWALATAPRPLRHAPGWALATVAGPHGGALQVAVTSDPAAHSPAPHEHPRYLPDDLAPLVRRGRAALWVTLRGRWLTCSAASPGVRYLPTGYACTGAVHGHATARLLVPTATGWRAYAGPPPAPERAPADPRTD